MDGGVVGETSACVPSCDDGALCDTARGSCVMCVSSSDCDDGDRCTAGSCVPRESDHEPRDGDGDDDDGPRDDRPGDDPPGGDGNGGWPGGDNEHSEGDGRSGAGDGAKP
jgi:hypothetical protein